MDGASGAQKCAPCLNKWSKGTCCQTLPSDKHSWCSLTSQAAGTYLRAALGLQMCCFSYFAIPVQKWIFSSLNKRSSVPHPSLLENEAQRVYQQWLLTTGLFWDSHVLQPGYRISDMNTQGFIGPTRMQGFAGSAVQRVRRSQRLSFVG